MGVDRVFTTPVRPTTSSQATVTTPMRLWVSSHFSRAERPVRTTPKSSLRMNGA